MRFVWNPSHLPLFLSALSKLKANKGWCFLNISHAKGINTFSMVSRSWLVGGQKDADAFKWEVNRPLQGHIRLEGGYVLPRNSTINGSFRCLCHCSFQTKKSWINRYPQNYSLTSKLHFVPKIVEKVFTKQRRAITVFVNHCWQISSSETAVLEWYFYSGDAGESLFSVLLSVMVDRAQYCVGITSVLSDTCFCSFVTSSETLYCSILGPILFVLYMLPLEQLIGQFSIFTVT